MPDLDRRKLLHAGIALAVPVSGMTLLGGCQQAGVKEEASSDDSSRADETQRPVVENNPQENKGEMMQLQYLEIVTPEADALCKQYESIHGITFGEPQAALGNARLAKLGDGSLSIRGPMRDTETPVIRPYMLVENLEDAVAKAADAGAEVAIPKMEIPGHGTIAIVIQGGIECGLWQA